MEDMCDDEDCTDDAEWTIVEKAPDGKEHEHQLCKDHMQTFVKTMNEQKADPNANKIVKLEPYVPEDEDDEDEDDDEEDEEDELEDGAAGGIDGRAR